VLSLLFVQIIGVVGLVGSLAGLVIGRPRASGSVPPVRVLATNPPLRGTQTIWVGGTIVAVLWGVGVFLAPTYAYHWPPLPDFEGSWLVQLLGVGLAISGGALFFRAARRLGVQMTPAIQVRQGHQLLQTGPYRYIRHPVYTAILLVAIGQTLFFLSPIVAALTITLAILAVYRARLEESLLASPAGFGATYVEYMARTGRFLPRWRAGSPGAPGLSR
jgi:protein-S-isoprenylcysteine O-methyltransferase Ste14